MCCATRSRLEGRRSGQGCRNGGILATTAGIRTRFSAESVSKKSNTNVTSGDDLVQVNTGAQEVDASQAEDT